jgi:hypothetical protein
VSQGDFAGEASESGALFGDGTRQPQIFVDDNHLVFGPTQLSGSIGQSVLSGSRFAVMLDLARRGLANVNAGGALGVGRLILEGSVIALLLVLIASRWRKKPRQSLDDDSFLLVLELLPQVRLRNRDVVEVQI